MTSRSSCSSAKVRGSSSIVYPSSLYTANPLVDVLCLIEPGDGSAYDKASQQVGACRSDKQKAEGRPGHGFVVHSKVVEVVLFADQGHRGPRGGGPCATGWSLALLTPMWAMRSASAASPLRSSLQQAPGGACAPRFHQQKLNRSRVQLWSEAEQPCSRPRERGGEADERSRPNFV
jgi:hypothetical protein